jgi:hypothetical protein
LSGFAEDTFWIRVPDTVVSLITSALELETPPKVASPFIVSVVFRLGSLRKFWVPSVIWPSFRTRKSGVEVESAIWSAYRELSEVEPRIRSCVVGWLVPPIPVVPFTTREEDWVWRIEAGMGLVATG